MEHPLTCSNNASPTIPSISTTKNVIQVQALDAATVTDITTNPIKQTAIQLPVNATIRSIPTATTTSIPRWTVIFNNVHYQQRQPNSKNHITFRCNSMKDIGDDKVWMEKKNKNIKDKNPQRCNGKFELTGWSIDPAPHFLNFTMQHDCPGKFPTIDQIGHFFENTNETMVEFIPDIDGDMDMDMRDLFTIHCPPEMIRQSFLKNVTDNIQIIDTDKRGGWKALTGGNGMRFHFPDMETQQPRLSL
jgi:hypothetical protein